MEKILGVLKSRKFWASVVGVLVSVGLLSFGPGSGEDQFVEAILVVVSTVAYVIGVAVEDAGRAMGGALKE